MATKKQYGLINPKAAKTPAASSGTAKANFFQKKNVFDDDDGDSSSSDGDGGAPSGPTDYVRSSMAARLKKQDRLAQQKALQEDATVFQYDEVYDDMQSKKAEEAAALKKEGKDRKPKYIQNLLKQAEVRNREHERRIERKVQREREAEGDEFRDKEVFVTSAYRKKMEEMQEQEEEEQRRERMEAALDVTKQKDLGGFYRHLYRQTMGEEKGQKEEGKADDGDDKDHDEEEEATKDFKKPVKGAKDRGYRKKSETKEESEGSDEEASSSDGGSSSSDSDNASKALAERTREEKEAARRKKMKEDKERREKRKRKIELGEESSEEEGEGGREEADDGEKERAEAKAKEEKAKRDEDRAKKREEKLRLRRQVWSKKTVGDAYEAALQRYFERKAQRSGFPWT